VRHLLDAAASDPALRMSLPMGVDLGDPAVLEPHLRDTVSALRSYLDTISVEPVAERITSDLIRQTRAAPIAPLEQLAAAESVDAATLLRLRPGLRCTLVRDDAGLRLRMLDKAVPLPLGAEAALKTVLVGRAFAPGELPGLDPVEQLALVRTLLREAVVVPAVL